MAMTPDRKAEIIKEYQKLKPGFFTRGLTQTAALRKQ